MRRLGRRSAVVLAVALAALAFAVAFAIAHGTGGGSDPVAADPPEPVPVQPVTINNLERAPSIKPLRSVAGEVVP